MINYSLYEFRGKESLNRIELSQLVQDLLNFGVLGSLQLWGGGRWVGDLWGMGVFPHMCTHTCMYVHTHVKKLQMAADMMVSMFINFTTCCTCMCVCICAHVCMHGTPPTHPPRPSSTHPPHPQGGPPESVKIQ